MKKLLMLAAMMPLMAFAGSFTVKYDANGGTGTMYAQMFEGDTLKLSPNRFSKAGYVFVGWSRHPDENPCYADQSVVTKKSLSITDPVETGDEQTLYAAWGKEMIGRSQESMIERIYPGVRLYTGGSDGYWVEDSAVAVRSKGTSSWIAAVVKGPGLFSYTAYKSKASDIGCLYAFVGGDSGYDGLWVDTLWSSGPNHGAKEFSRSVEVLTDSECVLGWDLYDPTGQGVMKLYAISYVGRVTVSFDACGGTVYEDFRTYNVGEKYGSLPEAFQRGKTFLGWYTEQGDPITEGSIVSQDVAKLYAHWSGADVPGVNYVIRYDLDGGTAAAGTPASARENEWLVLPSPTKPDCVFGGWQAVSGLDLTCAVVSTDGIVAYQWWPSDAVVGAQLDAFIICNLTRAGQTVTLKALWIENKYDLVYQLDGGTAFPGTPASARMGEWLVLPSPTRAGYRFGGWQAVSGLDTTCAVLSTDGIMAYQWWPFEAVVGAGIDAFVISDLGRAGGTVTLKALWTR